MRFERCDTLQELHVELANGSTHLTGQWYLAEYGSSHKLGWHPSRASALGRNHLTDPGTRTVTSKLANKQTKQAHKPTKKQHVSNSQAARQLSSPAAQQHCSTADQLPGSPAAQPSSRFISPPPRANTLTNPAPSNQHNQARHGCLSACPKIRIGPTARQPNWPASQPRGQGALSHVGIDNEH